MDKMCIYCVNPLFSYTRKFIFTCFFTCIDTAVGESFRGTRKFRERYPSPLRRPRRRVGMQDRFPGVRGKVGCGWLVRRTRCRWQSFPRGRFPARGATAPSRQGWGLKGSQGPACRRMGGWRNRPRGRSFGVATTPRVAAPARIRPSRDWNRELPRRANRKLLIDERPKGPGLSTGRRVSPWGCDAEE